MEEYIGKLGHVLTICLISSLQNNIFLNNGLLPIHYSVLNEYLAVKRYNFN